MNGTMLISLIVRRPRPRDETAGMRRASAQRLAGAVDEAAPPAFGL
eukprot:gene68950-94502_t